MGRIMKIGIAGTHCSGKTTLANYLAMELNLPLIEEIAANYKEKDRQKMETQLAILNSQIEAENQCDSFVSDRTVFDNLCYCTYHFNVDMENRKEIFDKCIRIFTKHALLGKCAPYDVIVLIDDYFPLEDNGVRNLDIGQQQFIHKLVHLCQNLMRLTGAKLIHVHGSTEARISQIMEALYQ